MAQVAAETVFRGTVDHLLFAALKTVQSRARAIQHSAGVLDVSDSPAYDAFPTSLYVTLSNLLLRVWFESTTTKFT